MKTKKTIKNTKIVCTLGPACDTRKTIKQMVKAGMNAARLNFSHGTHAHFKQIIKNVRDVAEELNQPIAIIQDLQGPKIRVGEMPKEGIKITKGNTIFVTNKEIKGKNGLIPIRCKNLTKILKKGSKILIEDGLIQLTVSAKKQDKLECKVEAGGIIKSHKGVNMPGAKILKNPITKKDEADLEFGLTHNVDYVALSFVSCADDIKKLRNLIEKSKNKVKIIAKIETEEAVKNLEEITIAADGLMVARGDLAIETEPAIVPIIQKKMIMLAKKHGKPVIVATQMLQSMIDHPIATRAEVSDTANAVFDATDALMLSNETAVGQYPVKAVETLSRVAEITEQTIKENSELIESKLQKENLPISNATSLNAAKLALDIDADHIVAITMSGFTPQHVAKHRLYLPIITITSDPKVRNQLALVWGLNNIYLQEIHLKTYRQEVKDFLKKNQLVKKGDELVIVCNASKKEKMISTLVI